MKWILLWMTMAGNGTITSGSAEFATMDACFAGQRAYGGLGFEITKGRSIVAYSESTCVNSETGEQKTAIKPRQ